MAAPAAAGDSRAGDGGVQGNVEIENASSRAQEIDIVKGCLQPLDVQVDRNIEESTHGIPRGRCSSIRVHRQGGEEGPSGREDQDAWVGEVGLKPHAQPSAVEEIFSCRQVTCLGSASPFNRDKITPKAIHLISTRVVPGELCSAAIAKRFVVSGSIGERFVISGSIGERFVISGSIGEWFVISGALSRRICVAYGFLDSFRLEVAPGTVFYLPVSIEDLEIHVSPVRANRHFHRPHRRAFTRPEKEDEGFPLVNLVFFVFSFFAGSQYFNSREVTAEALQAFDFSGSDEAADPGEGNESGQQADQEGHDEGRTPPRARGMSTQVFLPF